CSPTCGVSGCGTHTTVVAMSSERPRIVVASPWWVPIPPLVTSRRVPRACAAPSTHSSLRGLFPPYSGQDRSSRFTKQAPAGAPGRASGSTGVGSLTNGARGSARRAGWRRSSAGSGAPPAAGSGWRTAVMGSDVARCAGRRKDARDGWKEATWAAEPIAFFPAGLVLSRPSQPRGRQHGRRREPARRARPAAPAALAQSGDVGGDRRDRDPDRRRRAGGGGARPQGAAVVGGSELRRARPAAAARRAGVAGAPGRVRRDDRERDRQAGVRSAVGGDPGRLRRARVLGQARAQG